ncbi:MAG TPA: MoaD/ThiS family protein [Candidatus Binatia bacterium]|jgi:molybdopterin converting factor small subunit|nr:MoaD/ThiS family protein [Candidatus Binatia bacterium]
MKTVFVRLNGSLAEALGTSRLTVQLPEPATLADLIANLSKRHPSTVELLSRAVPVSGGKHLGATFVLPADQEVALLMPIAGG